MFAPRSLFGQVVLSQIVLMAAIAIVLPILLSVLLRETADSFVAERLNLEAHAIAAGARPGTAAISPMGHMRDTAYREARGGRRYAIVDAAGHVFAHGPYALPLPLSVIRRESSPVFSKRRAFDMFSLPLPPQPDGIARWVVIVQNRDVPDEIVDDVVRSFLARFLWLVPGFVLASLLVELFVIRRVTGNFRRAAAGADAISLHRIDVRLDASVLPLEAAPLVTATNRALDRLEAGYRFQGDFAGNVAHELRTPLALISLRAEGLEPSAERDLIQLGVERANHVVRQLMELAAIDRHYPQIEPIDPCELAREAVSLMAPLAIRANHDIAFVAPTAVPDAVCGVPGLVRIALTNMIDNAIRHTPDGCTITVSVTDDGCIAIEDDGPGIAIDVRDGESRRFRSKGDRRSDSAGLGLAIVERIMIVCGGALEAGTARNGSGQGGGARFTLRLSRRDDHPTIER
ncbi:sensor histidine kinase [Novosphingobium lentum]|uniref:sensor histidine kinase n=1 Tax=Novosphingobium lentum TaxID=145287 RepID=UPI00146FFF95|nr:HAMP domain-containing sensor histidine kinase [Novosphingobium lentum]